LGGHRLLRPAVAVFHGFLRVCADLAANSIRELHILGPPGAQTCYCLPIPKFGSCRSG
jgi:hypothetical protein